MLQWMSVVTYAAARPGPGRLVAWLTFVLAFAGLNYSSRLLGNEDLPDDVAYRYSTSLGAAVLYGVMLGILLLITRGLPRRELFALRKPRSWPRAAALAGASYISILVISAALSPFLDATEEQGLIPDEWDSSRAAAFGAFFASVTVLAPIVEELTFRGLGFTLLAPYGISTAVVATAVLFGAAHGLVLGLPVLIAFGLLLGMLRAHTGSVYPSMILHGIFNGLALIVSVAVLG